MSILSLKSANECRWDLVSLGEILLRFDPGDERIHAAHSFRVYGGGAEYNVACNLSRVFRADGNRDGFDRQRTRTTGGRFCLASRS